MGTSESRKAFWGVIAPCGLGWAGLIKNICRSTLLSAFASLIDWEVGAGPWRVTPSLGTGDTQGWVCRDTCPYSRALFLLLPGVYAIEGRSRKMPWWRRGRAGAELDEQPQPLPAFSLRLVVGANRSLPLSHQLQTWSSHKVLRDLGSWRALGLQDSGVLDLPSPQ